MDIGASDLKDSIIDFFNTLDKKGLSSFSSLDTFVGQVFPGERGVISVLNSDAKIIKVLYMRGEEIPLELEINKASRYSKIIMRAEGGSLDVGVDYSSNYSKIILPGANQKGYFPFYDDSFDNVKQRKLVPTDLSKIREELINLSQSF